ncbi:RcnB family protein [Brevundimonas sp. R86498]|uniref:RcnB family protein n=1 Tax=Brevundimonas sp. R86498 TaxID=3093845 RepID=UPI0037CCAF65
MKSMLTAFAALTALALPAGLPTVVMAQEEARFEQARPSNDAGGRGRREQSGGESGRGVRQDRAERPAQPDRSGGGGQSRRDRGGSERGGGDQGRGERPRFGEERGGGNRGEGRGGWTRPDTPTSPVVTPPSQDRGSPGRDRNRDRPDRPRGNEGRDRNGGWTGGDRSGRDRNDGRDRNNGGWNGGQNNGGWDRDRNNGGRNWSNDRQGRRDYDGFRNRWNQNDWRRDWNRSRSHDWWRNDRGFRGYTGFRSGFYFAPNYGYYAVPRAYFGQRWYPGSYLPSIFWRYSLNDYRTYGLGYPPPGTQWVAVDTTIYLIDSRDGYIIEVIHDAWRW